MEVKEVCVGVLTVSDRCSRGEAADGSGAGLAALVAGGAVPGGRVVRRLVVPDERAAIAAALRAWVAAGLDLVLTTGGTGPAPRDVTPEATAAVLERRLPGLEGCMLARGLAATPMAALSRGLAGVAGSTLIINLPGSVKGSAEGLEAVAAVLPHAIDLVRDRLDRVAGVHEGLNTVKSKVSAGLAAGRDRVSKYPLLSVREAQERVLAVAGAVEGAVESVPWAAAMGAALAADVLARDPLPPFPASVKDGYAVVAADGAGPRAVVAASSAGDAPHTPPLAAALAPGTCVRVNTGAPVPPGADAVVQVEDTALLETTADGSEEVQVEILKAPALGQDIRPVGSDVAAGQTVLGQGSCLGACELGVLATVGATTVQVFRKPVVAVLSTGNELVDVGAGGAPLPAGKVRDSNRPTLLALLREEGFECVDRGIARDDPDALLAAVSGALQAASVVVTTGSVSMGERDYLKAVMQADLGASIHFGRVQMKPGKPTTFASLPGGKLWFGLPGNPVSAWVTSLLFVVPALRTLARLPAAPPQLEVTLAEPVALDERPEFRRALLTGSEASVTGNQTSSRLLSCCGANCLLVLPAATPQLGHLPAGSRVQALLTRK